MTIEGFDARWSDFPHYILGITEEIWEGRDIAALHRYYAADVPVRMPMGLTIGREAVIRATTAALAEFPDRSLLGEDVIWSGDLKGGFLSSHRLMCSMTQTRDGVYGPATGKCVRYRVIADCAARDDMIFDEWLVRDQGAIVRQLGWDPKAYAADLIACEGGPERCARPLTPASDVPDVYTGRGNDHLIGKRYEAILRAIFAFDFAAIGRDYDRAVQSELPGGLTGHGRGETERFWMGLRGAFPDAKLEIHHRIGREDPSMPPRAAIRWSLTGIHSGGGGAFGPASGAAVHVMGISHAEFGPWGLRREYVLIDEAAIWKQILLKTG
jgi:predicted ester cyclase